MIARIALTGVRRALTRQAATALLGPRQVGKTTLAQAIARTSLSWEGFVIENLLAAAHPRTRASFYRTAAGAEIDLVLEVPGLRRPIAIEIKRGLAPRLGKGFHSAYADLEPERAFVVHAGSERYPVTESTEALGLHEMARMLAQPRLLRS